MFLGYNVNVFIFVHIDADDDFQVPDWHVGQCQSGRWSGGNKINYSACNWYKSLMNPLMILVKIIKLRWIHILSYDQMVSRKINNQTTRCANSIFYTTLFTNSAPNYT
ncbi:hypothetical protein JO94_24355 [Salmonella enterica subsp. enterica serovar Senftenberg]|nr:hypothetical protein [Salmonella enterica subsp. enterica serovar Senftenberg]